MTQDEALLDFLIEHIESQMAEYRDSALMKVHGDLPPDWSMTNRRMDHANQVTDVKGYEAHFLGDGSHDPNHHQEIDAKEQSERTRLGLRDNRDDTINSKAGEVLLNYPPATAETALIAEGDVCFTTKGVSHGRTLDAGRSAEFSPNTPTMTVTSTLNGFSVPFFTLSMVPVGVCRTPWRPATAVETSTLAMFTQGTVTLTNTGRHMIRRGSKFGFKPPKMMMQNGKRVLAADVYRNPDITEPTRSVRVMPECVEIDPREPFSVFRHFSELVDGERTHHPADLAKLQKGFDEGTLIAASPRATTDYYFTQDSSDRQNLFQLFHTCAEVLETQKAVSGASASGGGGPIPYDVQDLARILSTKAWLDNMLGDSPDFEASTWIGYLATARRNGVMPGLVHYGIAVAHFSNGMYDYVQSKAFGTALTDGQVARFFDAKIG